MSIFSVEEKPEPQKEVKETPRAESRGTDWKTQVSWLELFFQRFLTCPFPDLIIFIAINLQHY